MLNFDNAATIGIAYVFSGYRFEGSMQWKDSKPSGKGSRKKTFLMTVPIRRRVVVVLNHKKRTFFCGFPNPYL